MDSHQHSPETRNDNETTCNHIDKLTLISFGHALECAFHRLETLKTVLELLGKLLDSSPHSLVFTNEIRACTLGRHLVGQEGSGGGWV